MRRDSNRRERREDEKKFENKLWASGSIILLLIVGIVVCIILYANQMKPDFDGDTGLTAEKLSSLTQNSNTTSNENVLTGESTESASSQIGKTVEESKDKVLNTTNENNSISNNTKTNTTSNSKSSSNKSKSSKTSSNSENEKGEIVKKEINFIQPVQGDIIKEYAKENLVYSSTLEEWVTHLGIDIKADKTTVVKSASDGVIRSIKNDPRYGLTVVINHDDGYQTVYANLLTAEFVSEGESVTQGQTIGTVGNTAVFEISDESHLHFEILKDSVQVDPTIYIKGD